MAESANENNPPAAASLLSWFHQRVELLQIGAIVESGPFDFLACHDFNLDSLHEIQGNPRFGNAGNRIETSKSANK